MPGPFKLIELEVLPRLASDETANVPPETVKPPEKVLVLLSVRTRDEDPLMIKATFPVPETLSLIKPAYDVVALPSRVSVLVVELLELRITGVKSVEAIEAIASL